MRDFARQVRHCVTTQDHPLPLVTGKPNRACGFALPGYCCGVSVASAWRRGDLRGLPACTWPASTRGHIGGRVRRSRHATTEAGAAAGAIEPEAFDVITQWLTGTSLHILLAQRFSSPCGQGCHLTWCARVVAACGDSPTDRRSVRWRSDQTRCGSLPELVTARCRSVRQSNQRSRRPRAGGSSGRRAQRRWRVVWP